MSCRAVARVAIGLCSALLAGCQARESDIALPLDSLNPGRQRAAAADTVDVAGVAFRFPATRAGHLQHVGTRLKFIDCASSGEARSVEDNATDDGMTLLRELDAANNGISVVIRVTGDSLVQIRYGATEGAGCDRLPPDGDLAAAGNEPFWSLEIAGDSAMLRTAERAAASTYADGRWSHADAAHWRFVARPTGNGTDSLNILLAEEKCVDTMSGARYPFRATITRGGATLSGCALEGRRAFR